jgi:hypothetical protein
VRFHRKEERTVLAVRSCFGVGLGPSRWTAAGCECAIGFNRNLAFRKFQGGWIGRSPGGLGAGPDENFISPFSAARRGGWPRADKCNFAFISERLHGQNGMAKNHRWHAWASWARQLRRAPSRAT